MSVTVANSEYARQCAYAFYFRHNTLCSNEFGTAHEAREFLKQHGEGGELHPLFIFTEAKYVTPVISEATHMLDLELILQDAEISVYEELSPILF